MFQHLDVFQGAKKHHLFFGLMRTYRKLTSGSVVLTNWLQGYEYSVLALTVLIQVIADFASPIGINMILE